MKLWGWIDQANFSVQAMRRLRTAPSRIRCYPPDWRGPLLQWQKCGDRVHKDECNLNERHYIFVRA